MGPFPLNANVSICQANLLAAALGHVSLPCCPNCSLILLGWILVPSLQNTGVAAEKMQLEVELDGALFISSSLEF